MSCSAAAYDFSQNRNDPHRRFLAATVEAGTLARGSIGILRRLFTTTATVNRRGTTAVAKRPAFLF
ncbi:MAG: hypothetical protein CMJ58_03120 [Planctomycetaceae bacterium]|nr:hypothetical protein [Planctomycetaceae bacterium]